MLTINISTDLTVLDFIKNKSHAPFSAWRQTAKQLNFMLLFGGSAGTLAVRLENAGFTEKDCDDYLELTNQYAFFNTLVANSRGKTRKELKYLAVSQLMIEAFFNGYKGLAERIKREQKFAYEHGYVRCYHGPVRHLPELRFMRRNEKNELIGADKIFYSKQFSHIINQACNSTIQTMEARISFATWHNLNNYIKEWQLPAFIVNSVHDSLEVIARKDYLELVVALANACAAWPREPVNGIFMNFDAEVSDLSDMEHRDNSYYKKGVGIKVLPIEEALSHFNELHGTNLIWHGCES